METLNKLSDMMLIQFPVFSLNDDYIRTLGMIIDSKLDFIRETLDGIQK
mgnify:CR=1 FL=1